MRWAGQVGRELALACPGRIQSGEGSLLASSCHLSVYHFPMHPLVLDRDRNQGPT